MTAVNLTLALTPARALAVRPPNFPLLQPASPGQPQDPQERRIRANGQVQPGLVMLSCCCAVETVRLEGRKRLDGLRA